MRGVLHAFPPNSSVDYFGALGSADLYWHHCGANSFADERLCQPRRHRGAAVRVSARALARRGGRGRRLPARGRPDRLSALRARHPDHQIAHGDSFRPSLSRDGKEADGYGAFRDCRRNLDGVGLFPIRRHPAGQRIGRRKQHSRQSDAGRVRGGGRTRSGAGTARAIPNRARFPAL